METGYLSKEIAFITIGLDGFDHLQAIHGVTISLTTFLLHSHGEIRQTPAEVQEDSEINQAERYADESQGRAVLIEKEEEEYRHSKVQKAGGRLVTQDGSNGFRKAGAGCNFPGESLLEEFHGELQKMPEEASRIG